MTFRPYHAVAKPKFDKDQAYVVVDIEKCYIDDPDSWSERARRLIENDSSSLYESIKAEK